MKVDNCAIIVPTLNREHVISQLITELIYLTPHLIFVDDGSTDGTIGIIKQFVEKHAQIILIVHDKPKGKGAAIKRGLLIAKEKGYRYAITMDSDGQSDPAEIPHFIKTAEEIPDTIIVGSRDFSTMDHFSKEFIVNKFSNFWFHLATDIKLDDTQSGFRLYPVALMENIERYTNGYEFELESIVFPAWSGVSIQNIIIQLNPTFPQGKVSNFTFRDSIRLFILKMVLVLLTFLWIWPVRFFKSLSKEKIKLFIEKNITKSPESNFRVSLAISFGFFMGLIPVWGFSMVITGVVAHVCKLNKILSLAASNLSLPVLVPFVLYGGCATGAYLLGKPMVGLSQMSFEYVKSIFGQYLLGSIIFGIFCSLIFESVIWGILSLVRKPLVYDKQSK